MIYQGIDKWSSPALKHYGVKGMKWGVRHDKDHSHSSFVERLRARSEARRIRKNEKAIASGDPRKVAKRFKKMNNEELKRAMERLNERKKIEELDRYYRPEKDNNKNKNNNGGGGGKQQDGIIAKNVKSAADTFVKNAVSSAVTSVVTGQSFVDSFKKSYGGKTAQEKYEDFVAKSAENLKRAAANSRNRLTTLENNEKIRQFNLKQEIAKNGNFLKGYKPGQLQALNTSDRAKGYSIRNSDADAMRKSALMKQVMKTSSQMPITNITMRYGRPGQNRRDILKERNRFNGPSADYVWHGDDDDSDFLEHYGVKGMKWGVRKTVESTGRKTKKQFNTVVKNAKRLAGKAYKGTVKMTRNISDINRISRYADKASKSIGAAYASSALLKSGVKAVAMLASNPYVVIGAAAIGVGAAAYGAHKVLSHSDDFFMHYGVKGMHWGVRKDSSSNPIYTRSNAGTIKTIKKGQAVYRISANESERPGGGSIYVSATKEDNKKWADLFFNKSFSKKYVAVKDIKVADATQAGKIYADTFLHSEAGRTSVRHALLANAKRLGFASPGLHISKNFEQELDKDPHVKGWWKIENGAYKYGTTMNTPIDNVKAPSALFFNAGKQTVVQKKFINAMKKQGYSAISDVRGYDVSDNPVIVFDKSDLKLVSSRRIKNFGKDANRGIKFWQLAKKRQRAQDIAAGRYYDRVKHY